MRKQAEHKEEKLEKPSDSIADRIFGNRYPNRGNEPYVPRQGCYPDRQYMYENPSAAPIGGDSKKSK